MVSIKISEDKTIQLSVFEYFMKEVYANYQCILGAQKYMSDLIGETFDLEAFKKDKFKYILEKTKQIIDNFKASWQDINNIFHILAMEFGNLFNVYTLSNI